MSGRVHWYEGQFLQPHHFQAQERDQDDMRTRERRFLRAYPYGLVEAAVSIDALASLRIRFDRLVAVMPSGTVVDYPSDTDLPSLDITGAFKESSDPITVHLGVPLHRPRRSNVILDGDGDSGRFVRRRYRTASVEVADDNTGENTQQVVFKRVNARLLLDDDDRTDVETIPLLRVVHGAGEDVGVASLDRAMVPPCLVLSGSSTLRSTIRDLANQVEASRRELIVQLSRGGFSVETVRGAQFEQLLRLRSLSGAAAILPELAAQAHAVTPWQCYVQLRELLGELAALHPNNDRFESEAYDHDDPWPAFSDLNDRIRDLLRPAGMQTWLKVALTGSDGVLTADLTEEHLTRPNEYFLGIKTSLDPQTLAKKAEDADVFKLMAKSMVDSRIRGVRLQAERHPPMQLPSQSNLHYFRMLVGESARMWDRISQERSVALQFAGFEDDDLDEVAIFMTVPTGRDET